MRPGIENAATTRKLTRSDDDVAVFIAQSHQGGTGFDQVALLCQANSQGIFQEVPAGNSTCHGCPYRGNHDRMSLGGNTARQPVAAELRQYPQTVMACAFRPRQIFVKGRVRFSKVEVNAFWQPKTEFVEER